MSNELLIRRRGVSLGNTLNANSYIQSGLVFQLDGIERGSNPLVWTDKKHLIEFPYSNATSVGSDYVMFDGTGCIVSNIIPAINAYQGTIEVCISDYTTSNCKIFCIGSYHDLIQFIIYKNKIGFSNSNAYNSVVAISNFPTKATYSINKDTLFVNSEKFTEFTIEQFNNTNQLEIIIGSRYPDGNSWNFNGKIHSIRVYDRILTDDEILHNQDIDRQRFNITY